MSKKTRNILSIIEIALLILTIITIYSWEIYNIFTGQHVMYNIVMILITSGAIIGVILNGKITVYHVKNRNNSSK